MSTLDLSVLTYDLDFLVKETGREIVGVSPTAIADKVFVGSFESLTEGYEVEVNGRDVELDTQIVINGDAYPDLPIKGSVLKDRAGTFYKVFEIRKEDYGPIYSMKVASRYAGED
tara:strand:+ start:1310 stop:1654 length:345 start_codon:yes stop_codon:yes gene_type:complete